MQFQKINALVAVALMAVMPSMQAHADTVSVEAAFNQLSYSLDQERNPEANKLAIQTFTAQIAQLQDSGVSSDEILSALKAKMPDAQTAKDIDAIAATVKAKNLSQAETSKLVSSYIKNAQVAGASWSDAATVTIITVAVILIVAAAIAGGGSVGYSSGYWDWCYDYYYGYYYECYVYY